VSTRLNDDVSVLIRKFLLVEYFQFDSLNEHKSESLYYLRSTETMSLTNLTESIEQKVRAARGSKTATPPPNKPLVADRSVIRQYKFISRKDYRDFFNSLSPSEARYLESPIPPDIRPEADGSVVIDFFLPS